MDRYKRQAALLKAIGHPVRLQIVDLLRIEPECVCHLSASLDKPQPYMSQQLAILRNAGVIVDERDGTNIYYRLADENVARQVTAACDDARPAAEREVVACCNCPKCSAARGQVGETYRVAC
jgi:DNA-binding transcriptional ArsR family regulator